jgi:hypothetical protein
MKKKQANNAPPKSPRRERVNPEALKKARSIVESLTAAADLVDLQKFVVKRDHELDGELERLTQALAGLKGAPSRRRSSPAANRARSSTSNSPARPYDYGDAWPGGPSQRSMHTAHHRERSLGATVEPSVLMSADESRAQDTTQGCNESLRDARGTAGNVQSSFDGRHTVGESGFPGRQVQPVSSDAEVHAQLWRLQAENSALRRELNSLDPAFFDELEEMKYR